MSDYDSDNICGLDMDFDGDKDFYDDLIYDDITEHCNGSAGSVSYDEEDDDDCYGGTSHSIYGRASGKRTSGTQNSESKIGIRPIIYTVFGIYVAISSGSILAGIGGAFLIWLIVSYVRLFIL